MALTLSEAEPNALVKRRPQSFHERILRDNARRMDNLLQGSGRLVRITIKDTQAAVVVGDGRQRRGIRPVEFQFESERHAIKALGSLRLYIFAKMYFDGRMKIIGSFLDAVDIFYLLNIATDVPQTLREKIANYALRAAKIVWPKITVRFESLEHYSLNPQLYQLFLDSHMQYTCARFIESSDSLDTAQENKFNFIASEAEKLLGPLRGKTMLDVGCGWGGQLAYFKNKFKMKCVGNTNCAPQKDYVETTYGIDVVYGDFSSIQNKIYDLITIVGMSEHLSPFRKGSLLRWAHSNLPAGGVVYLQTIAKPAVWKGGDAYRIAQEYVFPGHFLEYRSELEARMRDNGFRVVHVEEGTQDYSRTTALWVEKLQKNEERICAIVGQRNYRIFVAYLAYASKLFDDRRGSLLRFILVKT